MKIIAIIPARYASTRLKGKTLIDIAGKPMIQHVYERTKKASLVNDVIVATDDKRIFDTVKGFNGNVVMTSPEHKTGTDRIAEAVKKIGAGVKTAGSRVKGQGSKKKGAVPITTDIIVNVQGDEPLIEPEMIDEAIKPIFNDITIPVSTLKTKIQDEKEILDPNVVKVVTDKNGFALYFSRLPIPYVREHGSWVMGQGIEWIERFEQSNISKSSRCSNSSNCPLPLAPIYCKHIGLYVYKKDFLLKFSQMKPTPLEDAEKLEQLRILENGYKIKVVETRYNSIGVDTKEDLKRVRNLMQN